MGPDAQERIAELVAAGADLICVDVAHGHTKIVADLVQWTKGRFPVDVIAGNVATAEGTRYMIEAGADAVRVGIGPGSIHHPHRHRVRDAPVDGRLRGGGPTPILTASR